MRGGRQTGRGTLVSHRMGFEARRRPEHGSRFQLMVGAGASLGSKEREMKGTESIHREFLKKFSIQAL